MDETLKKKIKKQLKLKEQKLYCRHNIDKPCDECMSKITGNTYYIHGDVSDISGDVSSIHGDISHIRGNVSRIFGDVSDILEILTEEEE